MASSSPIRSAGLGLRQLEADGPRDARGPVERLQTREARPEVDPRSRRLAEGVGRTGTRSGAAPLDRAEGTAARLDGLRTRLEALERRDERPGAEARTADGTDLHPAIGARPGLRADLGEEELQATLHELRALARRAPEEAGALLAQFPAFKTAIRQQIEAQPDLERYYLDRVDWG